MEKIQIPEREKRDKRLFVPVSSTEHRRIMQYCILRKVRLTDLVRFALKQTYDL